MKRTLSIGGARARAARRGGRRRVVAQRGGAIGADAVGRIRSGRSRFREALGARLGDRRRRRRPGSRLGRRTAASTRSQSNEKGMTLDAVDLSLCCFAAPQCSSSMPPARCSRTSADPGRAINGRSRPAASPSTRRATCGSPAAGLEPAPPAAADARRGRRGRRPDRRARGGARRAGRRAAAAGAPAGTGRRARAQVLARRQVPPADRHARQDGRPRQPDDAEPAGGGGGRRCGERGLRRRQRQPSHRRVRRRTPARIKRHWGAYGEKPTAAGGGAYDPNARAGAAVPRRHLRRRSPKDGMVYVCDRTSNRIQVFQKDGKFVKEGIVSKNTTGATVTGQFGVVSSRGSVWDIAFSNDAAAALPLRRRRSRQEGAGSSSATRWPKSAASATAAASRDASTPSAASRSIRTATSTRAKARRQARAEVRDRRRQRRPRRRETRRRH